MKKVTLAGGFHSSKKITINVSNKAYNALNDNMSMSISEWVSNYLSDYQESRLDNHFCGIGDCTCGSYVRATVYRIV